MAKIGNQQLIDPLLVDEIYDLGVTLSLSPCGVRTKGGSETNMVCFRNENRDAVEVENEGLTRVDSYVKLPAYTYTPISERPIGERSVDAKKGKEKAKEVTL